MKFLTRRIRDGDGAGETVAGALPAHSSDVLPETLAALRGRAELAVLWRGIEKESLRTTPAGELARTPHPASLGSALTHPHITMDFSEAQLEFITSVHDDAGGVLRELADIHRFVCANIGDELPWAASMPCRLGDPAEVPVARFGSSNVGRSKTVYRTGLSHRYGSLMEAISGIHYNFSLPETLWPVIAASRGETMDGDFVTRAYFGLIRNFRRYSWLLIYLFGASPVVCKSFLAGASSRAGALAPGLDTLDDETLYLPYATSLRMGRLGYQSEAQSSLHISYNDLAQYEATMRTALTTPYPAYEAIGVKGSADGEYRQLSTALLQIENEFYDAIRPKRRVCPGERPLEALHERGVEYVEVRCLDLDPFLPLGIDAATCRFLDVFLLLCLLDDSPPDDRRESQDMLANQLAVVERGRLPGLTLTAAGTELPLTVWADQLLAGCQRVAREIDAVVGDDAHTAAVELQRRKLAAPRLTPSARILSTLRRRRQAFFYFVKERSAAHRRWFEARPLNAKRYRELAALSEASLAEQARLEAGDDESFDDYLRRYLRLNNLAP